MTWSAHTAIRIRREQLGLTQGELATSLGVTKSFLSLIEGGHRPITPEHVESLSTLLQIPTNLLLLGSKQMPDDVRGVFETNTAEAIAAIRQHSQANAIVYQLAPAGVPLAGPPAEVREHGIPERIDVTKTSASYRAHSYHTKVPPAAITPFIKAFTRPNEVVFDPFCGSGMSGVAALMEGRRALMSDLSPAAVHIARNYTTRCDPTEFSVALARVYDAVLPTMQWLYRPLGHDGLVEYTTWSDVFRCPGCTRAILFWEAMRHVDLAEADKIVCPRCLSRGRKGDLEWLGEQPVQSHTSNTGSRRIDSHVPTRQELALIADAEAAPIPYWVPQVAFGPEREMWRGGHRSMGISSVVGFFTRRNLHALAALRHAIVCQSEGRVREALMFAFTAAVNRASRRYQWNAKRPTNVMTGTLYISSLRYEWNVWSLFARKAADVLRYYRAFSAKPGSAEVFQCSAAKLDCLPDACVDMIFMDPPFGSNIFYADASLLWDSWLGYLTEVDAEIVVNKSRKQASGGKSLQDYADLMQQSFAHACRVLKPSGRAVLAFSNSDDQVWTSVQNALRDAGFESEHVHVLSKGQPSIKGVKGVSGKESVTTLDLLLSLRRRKNLRLPTVESDQPVAPKRLVDATIRNSIHLKPCRTDEVYSAVIRASLDAHFSVSGITMPVIADRARELGATEHHGMWAFAKQEGDAPSRDFVAGYISLPADLPTATGSSAPAKSPLVRSVVGGRSSPLYQAHSYHTKVPPEAIAPFIEHFTKPGDVVLDPFCGSGMTGVAAAMLGRRAILSDLSPAAAHLAWNHTRACDPDALLEGFQRLDAALGPRFHEMYATHHAHGRQGYVIWTLWSTEYRCPSCGRAFRLWDAIDRESGRLGNTIGCPRCGADIKRSRLASIGSVPVWIAYQTKDGKRHEKAASAHDIELAQAFDRESITTWYPTVSVADDREMFIRCALARQGIGSIADFYTHRNLQALSLLWDAINQEGDQRVRCALAFAFTNTAWHGTKMRRFNARGGQRPLTGTLYVPQLSSEANVLEVMRNKVEQLRRYYTAFKPTGESSVDIQIGSATALSSIQNNSIDYVFTDPPFGSNLFYADCNLIWEAWLGRLTNASEEAVINRSLPPDRGGKSIDDYSHLISGSMREIYRTLKPGGWSTVVFHNTDAEVWEVIRNAAANTGFAFHEASSLDRQQQSHKGYKGKAGTEDVAHFDVVFHLRKPTTQKPKIRKKEMKPASSKSASKTSSQLLQLVRDIVKDDAVASRGLQGIHAEVMRRLASTGAPAFVNYAQVREAWKTISSYKASKNRL